MLVWAEPAKIHHGLDFVGEGKSFEKPSCSHVTDRIPFLFPNQQRKSAEAWMMGHKETWTTFQHGEPILNPHSASEMWSVNHKLLVNKLNAMRHKISWKKMQAATRCRRSQRSPDPPALPEKLLLHCALAEVQCCNWSCLSVCGCVGGSVTTITRNCVHRSSPN